MYLSLFYYSYSMLFSLLISYINIQRYSQPLADYNYYIFELQRY